MPYVQCVSNLLRNDKTLGDKSKAHCSQGHVAHIRRSLFQFSLCEATARGEIAVSPLSPPPPSLTSWMGYQFHTPPSPTELVAVSVHRRESHSVLGLGRVGWRETSIRVICFYSSSWHCWNEINASISQLSPRETPSICKISLEMSNVDDSFSEYHLAFLLATFSWKEEKSFSLQIFCSHFHILNSSIHSDMELVQKQRICHLICDALRQTLRSLRITNFVFTRIRNVSVAWFWFTNWQITWLNLLIFFDFSPKASYC